MAKSLRKRLEEEGKWQEIESTSKVNLRNKNSTPTINTDNGMWDRVIQNANSILQNMGLGAKGSFVNMAYGMQKSRETFSPNYKQTLLKQQNITDKLKGKEKEYDSNNILLGKRQKTKELTAIEDTLIKDEEKIQKNIEETTNPVSKKLAELTPSIGNSLTGMALSTVNPILGAELFFGSAMGQYTRDAEQRGMNAKQSLQYGSIMGAMEGASEFIGGQLTKGVGKAILKGNTKQALKTFGLDIAENFLEEASIEPVQEIVASLTGGKETADFSNMLERVIESGIDGALTSIITGGASAGIGKAVQITNKIENGQQISQQELKDAVQEIQKSGKIDVKNEIINNINQVAQNQATTMQNNEILQQEQQTIPNESKTDENGTSQEIGNVEQNAQNQVENNQNLEYNNIKIGEIKNISTKNLIPLLSNGGFRTEEQINELKNSIKQNGFISPIELVRKNDGTIEIENGNHRLQIANELGIKEIPVTFVESWENIGIPTDISETEVKTKWSESYDKSNGISNQNNGINVGDRNIERRRGSSNNKFENRGTTEANVIVSSKEQNSNKQANNNETKRNNQQVGDSNKSSFSMEQNKDIDRGVIKKLTEQGYNYLDESTSVDTVDNVSTSNNIIPQNDNNMQQKNVKNGLPQKPKLLKAEENNQKVTSNDYNRYKRKIIEGKQKELNNLIQIKNKTLADIQNKLNKKQEQFNSLKNKDSIFAQNLQSQIESLKERYNRITNEYVKRIEIREKRINKASIELETKRKLGKTRKEIQKSLLEQADVSNINLDDAKNILKLNMNRTDPIRLQEKVFGYDVGKKINEMFFDKVKHNTSEKTRFLNRERNSIKEWGIKPKTKESEVLQKYTEKTVVDENGKEREYTDEDLIKDIPDEATRNKIIQASKELRNKYDNYIDTANDILVDLGYSPIPKRKDYVRHFTELNDIFSKYGIPGKLDESLPTDINGLTESFRPGKNYFANAQKRLGNKTTYDAITGIDGYLEGIGNLIYHTEDIQRLRAFDKYIRDIYGQSGLENLDKLSDKEKNKRIELIADNHLSEYVSWLTEYTNNLAGKNSSLDRGLENLAGRKVYSALNAIKRQTGSNMTGFNLGSALTNFISVAQGASKTKKIALLKGLKSSLANIAVKDDFIDRSDFLTSRFGSEAISKKVWDKTSNAGQIFMSATDYLSSNIVVRSKYYEQLAKGKSETEAMKIADDFGARVLGDRSQGSTANVFNSKMLGIVTQFQLETNNQFDTFIHDTKKEFSETAIKEGALKASMGAVWTLGQLAVYQHIFNEVFEKINGNRPAFDIIEIIKVALGIENDDEDETVKGNLQDAVKMLVEQVPFINLLSENARVPISSAVPNLLSVASGESTLKKETSKLVYLLPPTGGGQAKKTFEGIKTIVDGGSYFINSKGEKELRFPVENPTAKDYIKAGLFGKYGLPLSRDYVENEYKRLNAKQTELYDNSTIEFRKLNQYLEYSKTKDIKKNDKMNYIDNMNISSQEKWDLYKYDIVSSTERKDGTSQLSDAEYIFENKLATKSEYMKLYSEAEKNGVEFPSTETLKELKESDLSLDAYMEYKTIYKKASDKKKKEYEQWQKNKLPISKEEEEKRKTLNRVEQVALIQNNKFSEEEKQEIYSNYIGKDDTTFQNLNKITDINIDAYLDYISEEIKADDDPNSKIKGKTISGSKKKNLKEYLNNPDNGLSYIERLYIYGRSYGLDRDERQIITNVVDKSGLTGKEKKEFYLTLHDVFEEDDGTIKWK